MKILTSFYEDRENEGEEDVEFRKKKQRMCFFVSEYKVSNPFLYILLLFYIIWLDLLHTT
jgi:hypothetical protein